MKEARRQFYRQQTERLSEEIRSLRKHSTAFIVGELASFAGVIVAIAAYTVTDTGYTLLFISALMVALYAFIRYRDVKNSQRIDMLEDRHNVYEKEQAYLDGDFSRFDDGAQYVDAQHPFTFDMDIFGHHSLFNRINRTITTGGSDSLARELSEWTCQDIACRQEALRELSEAEPLRTRFLSYGQRKAIDTATILSALSGMEENSNERHAKGGPSASNQATLLLAIAATVGVWAVVLAAIAGWLPSSVALCWVFVQFGTVFATNNAAFLKANKAVNRMHKELRTYISLIITIVESGLKAQESRSIVAQLSDGRADALESFRELQHILDALDRQGNALFRFLSDAFFCYDYWLMRRYWRWRESHLMHVREWIAAVSHFDALVSMATFRYNEPKAKDAEFVEADAVVYEAKAISHPFLGEKAVSNDFTISNNHYDIITGANMAGKSTFLRTIGINYILARCGMPVFADSLHVSRFALFTSMRTTDDLTKGISYFNAELLRLQQLLAFCKRRQHTLIILDEILKGTNSLDKLNGSRLFLENILQQPVTGIIATHDLELSKMADEHPDRIHCHCFEIELSDHVTYNYKLTPGVARNQNATFLLQNIVLKDISPTNHR